ncbi:hypothetical protein [Kitasatospora cineracea]|uniref:hypothetical protein n=1 Tax=Kitasatospora cineracea TaxID=88074 RepID=UPI0036908FA4
MTTDRTPNIHIALDAAIPIAQAMAALPIASRAAVRIGYLGEGVTAHYGTLAAAERNSAMATITTAFGRAGWGFHNRYHRDGETLHRTRFTHPLDLTWIGRPGTEPRTLALALDRALDSLSRPDAIGRLAPHATSGEMEAIATILLATGRTSEGAAWDRASRSR